MFVFSNPYVSSSKGILLGNWGNDIKSSKWGGGKMIEMDLGVFVPAIDDESHTYGNEGRSRLYV